MKSLLTSKRNDSQFASGLKFICYCFIWKGPALSSSLRATTTRTNLNKKNSHQKRWQTHPLPHTHRTHTHTHRTAIAEFLVHIYVVSWKYCDSVRLIGHKGSMHHHYLKTDIYNVKWGIIQYIYIRQISADTSNTEGAKIVIHECNIPLSL